MRLAEGDMDRATVYADDPAAQRCCFPSKERNFCMWSIWMVLLRDVLRSRGGRGHYREFPGLHPIGGGIRNPQTVERWFDMGVARLVIAQLAERPSVRQGHGA